MIKRLDYSGWHPSHDSIGGHVLDDQSTGADEHIVTHGNAANHFGPTAHFHVIANHWSLQAMTVSQSDMVINLTVLAYFLS